MSGLAEGSVQTEREVGRDEGRDAGRVSSELPADVANTALKETKTHDGCYKHYLHLVILRDGRGKTETEENRYLRAFQHLGKMFFAVSKNSAVMVFSKPALALRFLTMDNTQRVNADCFLRNQDLGFKVAYTMDAALEAYIDICLHEHVPKPAMPTFGFFAQNQAGPAMPNFGFSFPTQNQGPNQAPNQVFMFGK